MSERSEFFVYPGLSEEEKKRRIAVQSEQIRMRYKDLDTDRDPEPVKQLKAERRKKFRELREKEIAQKVKEQDAALTVRGIRFDRGKDVEISVEHESIEKFRTLKKLGVLQGRQPGRPVKG